MRLVKYPETNYLPWSPSIGRGNRIINTLDQFTGKRVVVTEKMDGENTTMYHSKIHSRSLDSINHPSRNWVKNFWSTIHYKIPFDIRICGENCFAKHSIHYTNLPSYFLGFNAWRENICLSWDETLDLFTELGIIPVRVIYDDIYNENEIKNIAIDERIMEGYVMRVADQFSVEDFESMIAKYVRKNHIETDDHWMHQPVVPNILSPIQLT